MSSVGRVLDVEDLRGRIVEMQARKYLTKWVHLDELFALIDEWEAGPSHGDEPLFRSRTYDHIANGPHE